MTREQSFRSSRRGSTVSLASSTAAGAEGELDSDESHSGTHERRKARKRGRPPSTGKYVDLAETKRKLLALKREQRSEEMAMDRTIVPPPPSGSSARTMPSVEDLEREMKERRVRDLGAVVLEEVAQIERVAAFSTNLKGTLKRLFRTSAIKVEAASVELASRASSSDRGDPELEAENARLVERVASLEAELRSLRAEIALIRADRARVSPLRLTFSSPPPPPSRVSPAGVKRVTKSGGAPAVPLAPRAGSPSQVMDLGEESLAPPLPVLPPAAPSRMALPATAEAARPRPAIAQVKPKNAKPGRSGQQQTAVADLAPSSGDDAGLPAAVSHLGGGGGADEVPNDGTLFRPGAHCSASRPPWESVNAQDAARLPRDLVDTQKGFVLCHSRHRRRPVWSCTVRPDLDPGSGKEG